MNKSNAKRIYWGLVLIAVAVFIILKCIGIDIGFVGTLPVIDIVLSLIILSITVVSVVSLNLWAVPFELSVIFMLFEKELAEYLGKPSPNIISNWLLLGCALLVSIGLGIISNPLRKKHRKSHFEVRHSNSKIHSDGNEKSTKFSSEAKYIDCITFDKYYYRVNLGDGNVYFDNTESYSGGGVLIVECKMGNMEIHVPRSWHIVTDIETDLGNVEIDGNGNENGPLITIQGICKMGNIEIKYC